MPRASCHRNPRQVPHDYIDELARGAIDAGADVYFNNGGSHMGIEIYKGRPIIYGLPSLFPQTEAVHEVPSAEMGASACPRTPPRPTSSTRGRPAPSAPSPAGHHSASS